LQSWQTQRVKEDDDAADCASIGFQTPGADKELNAMGENDFEF
jgi:hypothetical protein